MQKTNFPKSGELNLMRKAIFYWKQIGLSLSSPIVISLSSPIVIRTNNSEMVFYDAESTFILSNTSSLIRPTFLAITDKYLFDSRN